MPVWNDEYQESRILKLYKQTNKQEKCNEVLLQVKSMVCQCSR